jgi:phosphoribosylanthranilate isomerase
MQENLRPVRIQIAGVSSLEEALFLERLGVDALGFTVRLPEGPHDGLTEAKARSIIQALPPFIATVAITYVNQAREAIELCRYLGVTVLQLHGDFPSGELEMIRVAAPHLKIVRAVAVTGPEALAVARSYERRVDALILDTFDPSTGRRGATGKTHDWNVSAAIARNVRVPVILAGGLTPENVATAIATVRPWAVDVHTGVEDGEGRRDFGRMRAFVEAVRRASEDLAIADPAL